MGAPRREQAAIAFIRVPYVLIGIRPYRGTVTQLSNWRVSRPFEVCIALLGHHVLNVVRFCRRPFVGSEMYKRMSIVLE